MYIDIHTCMLHGMFLSVCSLCYFVQIFQYNCIYSPINYLCHFCCCFVYTLLLYRFEKQQKHIFLDFNEIYNIILFSSWIFGKKQSCQAFIGCKVYISAEGWEELEAGVHFVLPLSNSGGLEKNWATRGLGTSPCKTDSGIRQKTVFINTGK